MQQVRHMYDKHGINKILLTHDNDNKVINNLNQEKGESYFLTT